MTKGCSSHQFLTSDRIPQVVGPYSPAVQYGNLLFCSGQLGIDPETGKLVEGLEDQVQQIFTNLGALLEEAGSDLAHVTKTTVFMQNMADFPTLNQLYAQAFGDNRPARSTVEVAALPLGALVEIEAIAYVPDSES